MDDDTRKDQAKLHEVLAEALPIEDGFLTEWIIIAVHTKVGEEEQIQSFFGPATQTTWGALGLLAYAQKYLVVAEEDDG